MLHRICEFQSTGYIRNVTGTVQETLRARATDTCVDDRLNATRSILQSYGLRYGGDAEEEI